jgi:fluoride exporter
MSGVLWVALGGAVGSSLRYGVNVWSGKLLGPEFPWHTLFVNVAGCFAMGFFTGMLAFRWQVSQEVRLFLTTGVLGGFTTFSAFALDAALLTERRTFVLAAAYVLASVLLSLLGVFAGLALTRSST